MAAIIFGWLGGGICCTLWLWHFIYRRISWTTASIAAGISKTFCLLFMAKTSIFHSDRAAIAHIWLVLHKGQPFSNKFNIRRTNGLPASQSQHIEYMVLVCGRSISGVITAVSIRSINIYQPSFTGLRWSSPSPQPCPMPDGIWIYLCG